VAGLQCDLLAMGGHGATRPRGSTRSDAALRVCAGGGGDRPRVILVSRRANLVAFGPA